MTALSMTATTTTSFPTDYGDSFSTTSATTSDAPSRQTLEFTEQITDLNKIPTARYLDSIQPQTMTVNVLASVIAVQPPRTVHLRKRSGEMDIIELLVGDETRAGFTISFWLPPPPPPPPPPVSTTTTITTGRNDHDSGGGGGGGRSDTFHRRDMSRNSSHPNSTFHRVRDTLAALRPGHVVLVTHVALGAFQGNVYGQSLNRRFAKNNTKLVRVSEQVLVVGESSSSSSSSSSSLSVMAKVERVREWAERFVGRRIERRGGGGGGGGVASLNQREEQDHSSLPPDTQPGEL